MSTSLDSQHQNAGFRCVVCKRVVETTDCGTPDHAVVCHTIGNWGSTVFDEVGGHRLHFVLCDTCLRALAEEGFITLEFRRFRSETTWKPGVEDEWPFPNASYDKHVETEEDIKSSEPNT